MTRSYGVTPLTDVNQPVPGTSGYPSIVVRFGERLRTLRLDNGYTQTQLADYLGIDRSFISDVERGKKTMSLSYLETVAQGFRMTLSDLIDGL